MMPTALVYHTTSLAVLPKCFWCGGRVIYEAPLPGGPRGDKGSWVCLNCSREQPTPPRTA